MSNFPVSGLLTGASRGGKTVPIRFECEVTWDDIAATQGAMLGKDGWQSRWLQAHSWRTFVVGMVMCLGATLLIFALFQTWISLVAGAAVFGLTGAKWAYDGAFRRKDTWERGWEDFKASPLAANLVGWQELAFDQEGVTRRTTAATAMRPWTAVSRVFSGQVGVAVVCGVETWVLPDRVIEGEREKAALVERLAQWKAEAADAEAPAATGEFVSPPFEIGESHLYRAAALSARGWAPRPSEIFWGSVHSLFAVSMWPWWAHQPVSWLGAASAFFAAWIFVGSRLNERWRCRTLARIQLSDEALSPGFSGITIGIGPDGMNEASPRSASREEWSASGRW